MSRTLSGICEYFIHQFNVPVSYLTDNKVSAHRVLYSLSWFHCTVNRGSNCGYLKIFISTLLSLLLYSMPSQADETTPDMLSNVGGKKIINIAYLKIQRESFSGVPTYLTPPNNEGINGALSALSDANKTGKFLGYQLSLTSVILAESEKMSPAQEAIVKAATAVIIDSDPPFIERTINSILALQPQALVLNIRDHDNTLRSRFCLAPLLHVAPTYQMKADALGQWFRTKRIEEVLMVVGPNPEDQLYAKAFEQTAKQFKLQIVENKDWQFSFDLRRSAFEEIPAFTRSRGKYQAVFASDHAQQFAYALPYNTYYQVPVTGNAGLQALGWHSTHEQWGARQLQGRFMQAFTRSMTQYDYYAYVAVTSISTAVQALKNRSGSNLYQYLLSDKASIAAYKGRKLSFANKTRQLRQPLMLAHAGALVASAPLPGFLHQTNDLDTLGAIVNGCEDN